MSMAERIQAKLTAALAPERLDLVDDSARHAGHAAMKGLPPGETHFLLTVVSARFEGLPRLQRQRLVYQILAEEMAGGIHALAITALTPEENQRQSAP
ncbi:BolA family protein [uncultured Ferrovibrio sp.]|jgi:BolA protein|uniref:BolA family protein n=1 Tax=uncultured Ferrovibrio sp. TaxID=1576913 RepID=UPI00262C1907|nr:BolA family protein [uncultured Ferrovibrio sp.]